MRVAVIGGGIAGLAAAHRLVDAGVDAIVLEADARVGGVLRTAEDEGYLHEHAANAFLAGAPDGAVALCRELGVPLEEAAPAAKNRWIYVGGRLHALPRGPGDALRTGLLSWRGKLRVLGEPFRRARPPSRDGDESVYDFAARRLGPEVAERVIAPFVTGIFAGDARQVSLAAGFPKLAALEEKGGLVRGMFASKRDSGRDPKREKTRSMAPVGGVEQLVRALADRLGARIRRGARIATVRPTSSGVLVDGDRFDAAVLATPAHVTAAITADAPELGELSRLAASIPYAPAVVVYLGLRRADLAHPLDGFGVLVGAGEGPRILGVVFESSVWSGRAPEGHALLRCILGGTRDPGAVELDDAALIAQARADVGRVLGIDAAPVHTRVVRWPRAIAQYAVGHAATVAAADAIAQRHRLVLAGSGWHGVSVTDCVSDAQRVAREVAACAS